MGLVENGLLHREGAKSLTWLPKVLIVVLPMGLACFAIEMGAALALPRHDIMRLGVIPLRASPDLRDLEVQRANCGSSRCGRNQCLPEPASHGAAEFSS